MDKKEHGHLLLGVRVLCLVFKEKTGFNRENKKRKKRAEVQGNE